MLLVEFASTMPTTAVPPRPSFGGWDWAVVLGYAVVMAASGVCAAQRNLARSSEDYFLARHAMPVWAVAFSMISTALSAATFIGGPQQAFVGDLTYLSANLGAVLGALLVARLFIPVYYRLGVSTVYEVLEARFGARARVAASGMFMVGRVFAGGSRLFIAAIAMSLILFGDDGPRELAWSIAIFTAVGVAYTLWGGVASVIWTDVLQTLVFVGAAALAAVFLLNKIPGGWGEAAATLREATTATGAAKLEWLDTRWEWRAADFQRAYTVPAVLIGMTLFNMAAYGTDHDLAQRTLTCRSAVKGARSVLLGIGVGLPVSGLFMGIGLLLFVYYGRTGGGVGAEEAAAEAGAGHGSRDVFLTFILTQMPAGLKGLMMVGLFAAANINSTLNAMGATLINDVYKKIAPRKSERHYLWAGRAAVVVWGVVLAAFAAVCIAWHEASGQTLVDFALGVMTFAYAGLLAVFFAALFTRRGNEWSAMAALAMGFGVVLALQPDVWQRWTPTTWHDYTLAYPWRLLAGTILATAVCCLPRGRRRATPELRLAFVRAMA